MLEHSILVNIKLFIYFLFIYFCIGKSLTLALLQDIISHII